MQKTIERAVLAERLGGFASAGLGIFLALTPVALWIAWSAALVIGIVLIAALCAVLLALLESSLPSARSRPDTASSAGRVILPEEFIEEVHRLFPWTYHHSRHETTRFRQAMQSLSRLIEGTRPGKPLR